MRRPLFRRQPRPLELTSTGTQILPPIRDGFDAIAEVFGRVRQLHAIEAAVSGQGIAICSDVLTGPELASGALVPVSGVTLSGYGF